MKPTTRLLTAVALLVVAVATIGLANTSQAHSPDAEHLVRKGYSPEMVEATQVARSRIEWRRVPPPKTSPFKKVLKNIWTNDWTGSIDEPGYTTIRRI
jgi:hypothetical protein